MLGLLLLLASAAGDHFDCAAVCEANGRGAPGSGNRSDRAAGHSGTQCSGPYCLVLTEGYNRAELPAPRLGVRGGFSTGGGSGSHECSGSGSYGALDVATDLNILSVGNIDQEHGELDIRARVTLAWEEPSLGSCACRGAAPRSGHRWGADLQDLLWTPHLKVFGSKDFHRVKGLTDLVIMRVDLSDPCAARVSQTYDFKSTLSCPMELGKYPVDKNVCFVRVGSDSHPATALAFRADRPRSRHGFEDSRYRDFEVRAVPLTEGMAREVTVGFTGELTEYRATGVSLVITRASGAIILEYVVVMAFLVIASILTLTLCIGCCRANLVAAMMLSAIFVFTTAKDYTPHAEGSSNLVLLYCLNSLFFIIATFAWECLQYVDIDDSGEPVERGVLERLGARMASLGSWWARAGACTARAGAALRLDGRLDGWVAGLLIVFYIAFNSWYWIEWFDYIETDDCHNEEEKRRRGLVSCALV